VERQVEMVELEAQALEPTPVTAVVVEALEAAEVSS
jgi:hypothetical protein